MAMVPDWLQDYLKPEDIEKIENAIAQAEKGTTGEIVPMVVGRCSHVGHVPYLMMSLMVASYLSIALFISRMDWFVVNDFWLIFGSVLAMVLGYGFANLNSVMRFCVPKDDQWHQVDRRAELEFYEAGLQKTDGRTAILLFVSILERRAVVLADQGISVKLPADTWNGIVSKLIASVKDGQMADGLGRAILRCGEILGEHFPVGENGRNELLDRLIIKD
ncbi:MAG: TPM domain-containing protein [Oligoflexus sp.]